MKKEYIKSESVRLDRQVGAKVRQFAKKTNRTVRGSLGLLVLEGLKVVGQQ